MDASLREFSSKVTVDTKFLSEIVVRNESTLSRLQSDLQMAKCDRGELFRTSDDVSRKVDMGNKDVVRLEKIDSKLATHDKRFDKLIDQLHQERQSSDQRFSQMLAEARAESKDLLKSFREDSERDRERHQLHFDSIMASLNDSRSESMSCNSSNPRQLKSLSETVNKSQIYETRHFEVTQNRFDTMQVELEQNAKLLCIER